MSNVQLPSIFRLAKFVEKACLVPCNYIVLAKFRFESYYLMDLLQAGVCPYMCVKCGISFKLEHALNSHLKLQHDEHMDEKFKVIHYYILKICFIICIILQKIRGFITCNMCLAMIPCREMKAHIAKSHL